MGRATNIDASRMRFVALVWNHSKQLCHG